MSEEIEQGTTPEVMADAGNGNEPPPTLAATEVAAEPAPEGAIEKVEHAAHAWLNTLEVEIERVDEVLRNRLKHIAERIRETL